MIAVIKGDIVASRKLSSPERWLNPLKKLLTTWGKAPRQWELAWGDSFQLEINNPEEALHRAFAIKALVKKIAPQKPHKKSSVVDIRMSIGIGEKTFAGTRISESNGPAFIYAGEKFDELNKEKIKLAIQSSWKDFDDEMNLYLRLAGIVMDNWSVSSSELMGIVLEKPDATQKEIGDLLGIKQNSVSDRWNRAKADEILKVEEVYRSKLHQLIQK
jgi:hypothetical protein